ncbi:FCS-Like Zinc finger 10-like isoform X2 [Phragmites australis]|uniref:FCS-Like Zinc finger 10-like isoform X2 n=1 Tax=Phragmites australis TaxID=29695 RepID=UPI002D778E2D|nr:FCS-Like Zinc finger 10-like isoform X2 [Phragmites australis]
MLRRMVSDPAPVSSGGGGEARPRGGAALFAVPRLFVVLAPKRAPDGESSRSPTSPLDPKALLLRSPRSPRTWDTEPVGRGLVDALAGDAKNCLLSPRLRLKSYSSLPKNFGGGGGHSQPELGKTMSCPAPDTAAAGGMSVPCSRFFHGDLKSGPEATQSDGAHLNNAKRHAFGLGKLPGPGSLPASIAAGARRFIGSVSASEIEQSEDYTCIIARGPNPKTTHIFGDCILEPHTVGETDEAVMEVQEGAAESYWVVKCAPEAAATTVDFLGSCFTCKKKLDGNDIYIYRWII